MSRKALFVEGETDTVFFSSLIKLDANLKSLNIEVEPKRGVSRLTNALQQAVSDLKKGNIEYLGIVADADHNGVNNGGFHNRWQQLTLELGNTGYTIPNSSTVQLQNQGSIFTPPSGLKPVGLWLMPNHSGDGSLENLVLNTAITAQVVSNQNGISVTQQNLIDESRQAISNLATQNRKVFASHHDAKAEAFTWLAWQKKPRHFIAEVIDNKNPQNNLINITSPEIQGLINWLTQVFL